MSDVKGAIILAGGGVLGYKLSEATIKAGKYHMNNYQNEHLRKVHTRLYKEQQRLEREGEKRPALVAIKPPKPEPWAVVVTHPIGEPAIYAVGTILGILIAYIIVKILRL